MTSKLVDDLRRSLARPLTTDQKISQAFQAAESDEDREAIREIATAELQHAKSKDETLALLSAAGVETYEQAEDRAAQEDVAHPRVDPFVATEASEVMDRLRGLDAQWQSGSIKSRTEYAQRMAQLQRELESATERDATARVEYDQKVSGTYAYAQRFGEGVPTTGHGSFDPAQHGIRVGVQGTDTDPFRVLVPDGEDLTTKFSQAGSRAELLDIIRQSNGAAGVVLDDGE